jgi:hypothetical protein
MKTVLVTGTVPVPSRLRELVRRGSTSFAEYRAAELASTVALDVDRIVFWSPIEDGAIHALAETAAKAEAAERRETLVYVTGEEGGASPPARLSPNEVFIWPRDEDRLQMAFLTGA